MEDLNTQNDLLDFHQHHQLKKLPHKRLIEYRGLNGYNKRVYHHTFVFTARFSTQQLHDLLDFLDVDESYYTVMPDHLEIIGAVKHVQDDDSVHAHKFYVILDEALTTAFLGIDKHFNGDIMRDVLASTLRVQRLNALLEVVST